MHNYKRIPPYIVFIYIYTKISMSIIKFQLNPKVNDFQRQYVSEVRRCSEMERKLRWVAGQLPSAPAPPPRPTPRNHSPREINILEVSTSFYNFFSHLDTPAPIRPTRAAYTPHRLLKSEIEPPRKQQAGLWQCHLIILSSWHNLKVYTLQWIMFIVFYGFSGTNRLYRIRNTRNNT